MKNEHDEKPISGIELYTLEQFKRRMRLTTSAFLSLKRAGLPIVRYGKRGYVVGRQAIDFFARLGSGESQSS